MKILGTKSNNEFSKLICAVTKDPISHCALEFPEHNIIIHSNFCGIHSVNAKYFRDHNSVIAEATPVSPIYSNMFNVNKILKDYDRKMYDYLGFAFLGISLLLRNSFNIPLPKSNLWQITGMYMCHEFVSQQVYSKENSMMTPWMFMRSLPTSEWILTVKI